jgi:predicted metal-binding protein
MKTTLETTQHRTPDRLVPKQPAAPSLETAPSRRKLAQITLCATSPNGCGRTEKGQASIPVDWLKAKWKEHKLGSSVQLTVGGCFGACDLYNVACVQTEFETVHLGELGAQEDYDALLEWAQGVNENQRSEPLPERLLEHRFKLWRDAEVE